MRRSAGVASAEQIAGDFEAGRGDHLHRARREAVQQSRELRALGAAARADRPRPHHLRAAARELLLEEFPAVAALDDQYAAARRTLELRVPQQALGIEGLARLNRHAIAGLIERPRRGRADAASVRSRR